jgi:IS1 family transposase
MNRLNQQIRIKIIHMLVEGSSMRSISRVLGVSLNTVNKLLIDAGAACHKYHNEHVRQLSSKTIQCDEIWSFCRTKEKNTSPKNKGLPDHGDIWTWTAIDADTKLICSYLVGKRDADCAQSFITDLRSRLASRVQLTTDGYRLYVEAIEQSFGRDIDYAMLVKLFGKGFRTKEESRRYSPAECVGIEKRRISGNPDFSRVSTSFVERQNFSMRMHMRRFTRLTNGYSKKIANHLHAVSLYFMYYNFVKIHKTLKCTPAMEAGITNKLWDVSDILALVTAKEERWGEHLLE